MITRTRRDVVAIGVGLALGGSIVAQVDLLQPGAARTIEAFRTAVLMLREVAEPAIMEMRMSKVERLGKSLVAQGISRINPEQPCDGACNHWLASLQGAIV
jgi:hypothetical protein